MKRNLITVGIVFVVLMGIGLINSMEPERITRERLEEEQRAKEQLDMAAQAEAKITMENAIMGGSTQSATVAPESVFDTEGLEKFLVELECTNGKVVIEVYPEWSPLGVAQFADAIEDGVYDNAGFFRVVPGFVVQFGLPGDPEKAMNWDNRTIQDEPVKTSNVRGTVTYAKSSAPNSRTTQMFINLGNNANLDGMGFSPIGRVVEGMDVVDAINAEYGEQPQQNMITSRGNAYLKEFFPDMDYIQKTTIHLVGDSPENDVE